MWGTVIGPGVDGRGFQRRLVDSDFQWLVKACYHEAGTSNPFEWGAVLWVLTNRWAGRYGREGETLGQFAQRFCQPINPSQIGKIHDYDRTPEDPTGLTASRARDARIRANRARPVQCYATGCSGVRAVPELLTYVTRFMQGKAIFDPRYIGLTDFAARYAGHGPEDIPVALPVTGNVFYRETWTRSWTPTTVRIVQGSSGRVFSKLLPFAAGLGIVATVAWFGGRKR